MGRGWKDVGGICDGVMGGRKDGGRMGGRKDGGRMGGRKDGGVM